MLRLPSVIAILSVLAICPLTVRAQDQVGVEQPTTLPSLPPVDSAGDSGAIDQALDQTLPPFEFHGAIADALARLSSQTNLRITATQSVWDILPWGQDTVVRINVRNATVRQALDRITRRIGLTYIVGADGVTLEPMPALARMGRRATTNDLLLLDALAGAQAELRPDTTVHDLVSIVDRRLYFLHSPYAVDNRAFDSSTDGQTLSIPRNATLLDALEQLPQQTDATWYPNGQSLLICKKVDAIRTMLSRRVNLNFQNENIEQVLSDLSDRCGVPFIYTPGALQRVPPDYRRVSLTLRHATVQDTLNIISGQTGLTFEPTSDGVKVASH